MNSLGIIELSGDNLVKGQQKINEAIICFLSGGGMCFFDEPGGKLP